MALRTPLPVQPNLYMTDGAGRPLDGGQVYFGEAGKDPESHPVDVFYDELLTIAAVQPVATKNGFLYANGNTIGIYGTATSYSVKVLDAHGVEVLYLPNMSRLDDFGAVLAAETQRAVNAEQELQAAVNNVAGNANQSIAELEEKTAGDVSDLQVKDVALQNQINSIGGGKKAYETEALMVADKANIPAHTSIDVSNDPDPAKNGTYTYNGTVFAKSDYDPQAVILSKVINAFDTKAIMEASGLPDGSFASVSSDSTSSNNGDYKKMAGVWVKTDYDPVRISRLQAALLSSFGDWLTTESKISIESLNETNLRYLVARAVKKIAVLNPVNGKKYKINSVFKNAAGLGSRVVVSDDDGVVSSVIIPEDTVVSGIIEYALSGAVSTGSIAASVVIDWDEITNNSISNNLDLFIDNTKYKDYFAVKASTESNTLSIADLSKLNRLQAPTWLDVSYVVQFLALTDIQKKAANAIRGIDVIGADSSTVLRFSTIGKNDTNFATRVIVLNGDGTIVSRYDSPNSVTKKGLENLNIPEWQNSGISLNITIDWDEVPQGLPLSGVFPVYINPNTKNFAQSKLLSQKNALDISVLQQQGGASGATALTIPSKPYKVSVAGSSITWGQGYLGEGSYVGELEKILRNQHATTLHANAIAPSEPSLTGSDFYQGSAKIISGTNKEVSFLLDGDELSLSLGLERENTGASIVELYVDGSLYDTFNTATNPSVDKSQTFNGDGSVIKFNLDDAFTYGHNVTVAGAAQTGSVNTRISGAAIPAADDYMVIRRYDSAANKVVHALWFKTAPTGTITVDYKYGENIRHLKGTIDRVGAGYDTALESPYGDGATSYDPTQPSALSSGFGFRESDERSVKTWRFAEQKTRTFKLKIKSLHSSATGGTPYVILNFATNRMHHIQNAGIGGWDASELISDAIKLNTIDYVIGFNPDIVLIESCTNDDATTGVFKAHVVRTGVSSSEILASGSANWFTAISGTTEDKTINDVRIPIVAIDRNTVTLSPSVVDTNIAVGDTIAIGDYGGNHERVAVRTIKAYDNAAKKITLNRSISAEHFKQAATLNDMLSEFVTIYNAPNWVANVTTLIDTLSNDIPDCKVNIATAGIPHFYLRKLFGYRELGQKLARQKNVGFVDYYAATYGYQYSQPVAAHQTITSTGDTTYTLAGGGYVFADPKVFVDGVEHKEFRVVGGLSKSWAAGITSPTLSNTSNITQPFKLIFDNDAPTNGASIVVKRSATVWANDYCHPTPPQGLFVLGQAASKILKDVN